MRLSRPTLTSACLSYAVHICLLGWSASVILTQGIPAPTPINVTLVQPATPLPVGEKEVRGAQTLVPAPQPAPLPPPAQPEPKTKTQEKLAPPATLLVKKPSPKIVTAPLPPTPLPQPAAVTLPAEVTAASSGAAQSTEGATNANALGSMQTAGAGSRTEAGRGGIPGGASARPDYGFNPKPPYPLLARRLGAQGVVLLSVLVRADGSVAEAEVKHSSGSPLLDDSALRTVKESWRFLPARLDGVPVESWVEVPIRFVLGEA